MHKQFGLLLLLFTWTTHLFAVYPPPLDHLLSDYAGVVKPEHAEKIRGVLTDLRTRSGIQFTVVTINSYRDFSPDSTFEDFATGLFNEWGIGSADKNNGILLLVAIKDRKIRIELGKGYGVLDDEWAGGIISGTIIPRFKQSDYSLGILEGTVVAVNNIPGVSGQYHGKGPVLRSVHIPLWLLAMLGVVVCIILGMIWAKLRRDRTRRCPNCKVGMKRLDEKSDDSHLDADQRLEETLKSVDYDVWHCGACNHVLVIPYSAWFSKYKQCPNCRVRSYYISRTDTVSATYYSTGSKTVYRKCKNCNHSHTQHITLPRLTRETSSGSSGSFGSGGSSGSFGGGSSSGGGASGSW